MTSQYSMIAYRLDSPHCKIHFGWIRILGSISIGSTLLDPSRPDAQTQLLSNLLLLAPYEMLNFDFKKFTLFGLLIFFCHHALSSYYWLNFMRGLFFSKGSNFNVFKPERANTLEPFYLKANLGIWFWAGFDNQAFCQLFCAPFKMTPKINQERRKRRLFKGLKIVGHRIVYNSTNAYHRPKIKRKSI